jgi:hypothetical protein
MIVRADFVQVNGVAVLLCSLTYDVIGRFKVATLLKVPRRFRRLVISANEAFDGVEPKRTCRCKMDVVPRMGCEPFFDFGMLLRSVVVHDQMEIELLGNGSIDVLQELDEFFMPVARQTTLNDFPGKRIERGEQGRRPISLVVVRLPRRDAFSQRQDRRGSFKCLNTALLVDTEDDRVGRRIHIQSDDIPQLFNEVRICAELEVLNSMRLQFMRPPQTVNRATADAKAACHLISGPIRGILRSRLHGRRNRSRVFAHFLGSSTASRILIDAIDSPFLDAPANRNDVFTRDLPLTGDLRIRNAGFEMPAAASSKTAA